MSHQQNITRIKAVYNALEEIAAEVVFVGGVTVSLYTDRPAVETRPTNDVDILVEVAGYTAIEKKLQAKGFVNDQCSNVICRYTVQGITIDVMPTDETILGFSNQWYKEAFATAMLFVIDNSYAIRISETSIFHSNEAGSIPGKR